MPPAGKAGCCKSDHLSSYRGYLPQAATGCQNVAPEQAAKQPRQQSNSPSSPGELRPPAAKAGCCKSDQLSSYRGHRLLPQAATGRQAPGPRISQSSKATAQAALGDSCLQQARQDAANLITYLLIGATGCRHRLPQAAKMNPQNKPKQQGNSPSSPGGPAGKAGCCKSDHLSSYRGHRYLPSGPTGPQNESPEQAQAARQQPKQAWGTSRQGRMLQI